MDIQKARDHCYVTGKLEALDIQIVLLKLNHKIPALFHNLKNMIRI